MTKIINIRKFDFSQNEFILFTKMSNYQFISLLNKKFTIRDCLDLRQALKRAQTLYRKTHPSDDPIIWKSLQMWMKLERIARAHYMRQKMLEIKKLYPGLQNKTVKIEAKKHWENFVKTNSY